MECLTANVFCISHCQLVAIDRKCSCKIQRSMYSCLIANWKSSEIHRLHSIVMVGICVAMTVKSCVYGQYALEPCTVSFNINFVKTSMEPFSCFILKRFAFSFLIFLSHLRPCCPNSESFFVIPSLRCILSNKWSKVLVKL